MAKRIIRHEFIEIQIPKGSTQTRFNFPDIPNLRNSHLFGLQIYNSNEVEKSILSGNDVNANEQKGFITFVNYGGKEFLKQCPAVVFDTLFNKQFCEQDFKSFVGQKVSYPKSYVEFATAPSDPAKDTSLIFSVYYSLPEKEERAESGYSFGKQQ